ncbi:LysM domain-containing protein [Dysgonomonas sp. ZJ279]|uniref:LysM domain-containing protein n=1 Tax=Dysgonomonas sp. ZJ279 TaxID=2709796 RepID=UPI0013ECD480|nr:LysM domain-containing protein [Dysgonomonas sp. ZJ279]
METKVVAKQCVLDLAIQLGGSAESVFLLAIANGIDITSELVTGLTITAPVTIDASIYNYYRVRGIIPATEIEKGPEGIEFWRIEYDFIVS